MAAQYHRIMEYLFNVLDTKNLTYFSILFDESKIFGQFEKNKQS